MKTIAVINATKVSVAPVEEAVKSFPEIRLFHLMDEGMSYLGKTEGRISERNLRRMLTLIHQAEDLGVDGIMLSCTIFSPFIDRLQSECRVPLLAADVGTFAYASQHYQKVGAVVTFGPTVESVTRVIETCRQKYNPGFSADIHLVKGAFEAAAAGDDELHNRLIFEEAQRMIEGNEALILSQMSQMRALPLLESYPLPVLTTPPVTLKLLCDLIDADQKQRG